MGRRRARELAFRSLFQADRGNQPLLDVWRAVRQELAEEPDEDALTDPYGGDIDAATLSFAQELVTLYDTHGPSVDERLAETITGWTFGQMSQTDLNVLRLALTEMSYTDGPPEVAIEMAVRLAKKFGGDESGRFVNGVLAKLLRQRDRRGSAAASTPDETPDETPTGTPNASEAAEADEP